MYMKNRMVGFLLLGVALLMGFIILLFNRALTEIVKSACSHGADCPMWETITFQTRVSMGILAFVLIAGFYFLFFSRDTLEDESTGDALPPMAVTQEHYESIMGTLAEDERRVLATIIDSQGTIFQSDLVDTTGFPKAKVTRILDRLEGGGLIERRRRGMSNVVILSRQQP